MLPVGITIMVAAVVLGVLALTAVALTSSAARSAGRGVREAMALSDPEDDALYHDQAAQGATEAEDVPRWALALLILAGASLVLGLLLVMIASIP